MTDVGNEPASNSTCTREEEVAAYDKLPQRIRRFLSESPYNFDATGILRFYNEIEPEHGYWTTHIILDWLHRVVADQHEKEIKAGRLLPDA